MTFHELSFCLDSHSLVLEQLTVLGLNLAKCSCASCIIKGHWHKALEKFGVTTRAAACVSKWIVVSLWSFRNCL